MGRKLQVENCKLKIAQRAAGFIPAVSGLSANAAESLPVGSPEASFCCGRPATSDDARGGRDPAGINPAARFRERFSIFNFLFVVLLLSCSSMRAADPRQDLAPPGPGDWPMFRHDRQQLGVASSKLPSKLELLWVAKAGAKDAMIKSTAAIAGGHVFGASLNGEVFCLDLSNGKRLWTYTSREEVPENSFLPGFKAPVAVTADTVYVGDEEGWFHAINRADGTRRWIFETNAEITSSANFYEDTVLFGSNDNSLYCLRASDGVKAWQFETQGRVFGSPAVIGDHTFVAGCDEHLRVINLKSGQQESQVPLEIQLITSPAVIDNMLYVGTYGNEVLAIDWKASQKVWAYTGGKAAFHSSAAVNDKYVIAGSQDKKLHCIDRKTGEKVWTFTAKGHVDSSPVIVDDRVFVGSNDGNVYALGIADGKELWRHTDGRPFSASPAVGEGRLVIGSESSDGKIYCFGAKK